MFALILLVWLQGAQSLTPVLVRVEIQSAPFTSITECHTIGLPLTGPVLEETDPAKQYVWRDMVCVPVVP